MIFLLILEFIFQGYSYALQVDTKDLCCGKFEIRFDIRADDEGKFRKPVFQSGQTCDADQRCKGILFELIGAVEYNVMIVITVSNMGAKSVFEE